MSKSPLLVVLAGMIVTGVLLAACQPNSPEVTTDPAQEVREAQRQLDETTAGPVPADPEIDAALDKMNTDVDSTNDSAFDGTGLSETELTQ